MFNRLSDECIWGAGEATKSANKSNHNFFFCLKKKNPLSFAGAFQIQVWWAFHPQMIVCFEHINLWREFGVVAWICPQDSSNKQSWIYAFYVEGKKHQQGMANFFSFFSSRFDELLISLCFFRMKGLGVEGVAFCLSLWVCVCVCVSETETESNKQWGSSYWCKRSYLSFSFFGWVGVVVFGVLKFSTGAWLVSMLVRRGMQALEGQALALLLMCKDFLAVEHQLWIKLFYQESGLHVEEETLIWCFLRKKVQRDRSPKKRRKNNNINKP